MRNNKFVRISVLILALALCFGAAFAMSAVAEEPAAKPEIISQNVMYTDQFCLMYAVGASAKAPITLNVYRAVPDSETPVDSTYTVSDVTDGAKSGLGKDAYIFTVKGVGATDLGEEFYVQAVDADGNKSDLMRYSVAEYLYERLASDRATEAQKEFYNNTLTFGATAQTLFAEEGEEFTLITDYRYVTVVGGTINDYINESGIYPLGEKLTLRVPDAISSTWNVTTTLADGTTATVEATDKYVVTDAVKTELELVSTKAYRPEAVGFEDKTDGEEAKFFEKELNGGTISEYKYVYEEGRGMVLTADIETVANAMLKKTVMDESIVSKDEATAFEFSFDIKLDFKNDNTNSRRYVLPSVRYGSGSRISRQSFGIDKGESHLSFLGYGGGSAYQEFTDVECNDWFHLRIVYYKGDTSRNAYVYVNGSDTPFLMSGGGGSSSYAGDISQINRVELNFENKDSDAIIYLDNVFCGFTTDTMPAAE